MRKVGAIAIIITGLILSGCQSGAPPQNRPTGVSINNLAPDFYLKTLYGSSVMLSDLRGKPVLLNFWATWCGPCRAEMPFLQQIYDEWSPRGLVLIEVNLRDKPETIREFMSETKLSMDVALDLDGKLADDYFVGAIPTTFFIDSDGVIRQKVVGSFPNKEAIESDLKKIMP